MLIALNICLRVGTRLMVVVGAVGLVDEGRDSPRRVSFHGPLHLGPVLLEDAADCPPRCLFPRNGRARRATSHRRVDPRRRLDLGHKDDAAPYFQLIAAEGYAVASVDYSVAPGATYPTPIHQVNDALAYVQQNAARFHVDPDRIVLAGDSAGAQITSQIAALVTNPAFAAELGLTPALVPPQLRGAILFCGIYDMKVFLANDHLPGSLMTRLTRWGTDEAMWAYTGSRDDDSAGLRQMSSIDHVTVAFPPTFISGGNDDPLTDAQSRPLAATLEGFGVEVTTLLYPPDYEPGLTHEYQFNLDIADGQNALAQMLRFLKQHTSA